MIIKNPTINKSINYIFEHIDENISIDDVANYCNYSKYYLSRMFKSETGVSIYSFIKSFKMDQSAISIKIESDSDITDIGCNYGYSSSNYSSAFSKEFNISPSEFRKSLSSVNTYSPFYLNREVRFKSFEHYDSKIKVENLKEFKVLYERHIGKYSDIKGNWDKFTKKYKDYFNEETLMIEKSYNDPSISSFDKSVYDLCITVDKDMQGEDITTIKGGKFVVYRFDGIINDIFGSIQGIFNVWFPRSKYKRDDRYILGVYRDIDIKNNYVVMDLYVPIK